MSLSKPQRSFTLCYCVTVLLCYCVVSFPPLSGFHKTKVLSVEHCAKNECDRDSPLSHLLNPTLMTHAGHRAYKKVDQRNRPCDLV